MRAAADDVALQDIESVREFVDSTSGTIRLHIIWARMSICREECIDLPILMQHNRSCTYTRHYQCSENILWTIRPDENFCLAMYNRTRDRSPSPIRTRSLLIDVSTVLLAITMFIKPVCFESSATDAETQQEANE
jgi:hypothetical protein